MKLTIEFIVVCLLLLMSSNVRVNSKNCFNMSDVVSFVVTDSVNYLLYTDMRKHNISVLCCKLKKGIWTFPLPLISLKGNVLQKRILRHSILFQNVLMIVGMVSLMLYYIFILLLDPIPNLP